MHPDAVSDSEWAHVWASSYSNFSIDTHAPRVTFPCLTWGNNSVRPTNDETLCLSCGEASDESYLGCTIWYTITGAVVPVRVGMTTLTEAQLQTHYANGDRVVLVAWAEDVAGNVGPASTLTWTVDSLVPVTVWPSDLQPISRLTSTDFVMSCSRPAQDCSYSYRYATWQRTETRKRRVIRVCCPTLTLGRVLAVWVAAHRAALIKDRC